MYDAECGKRAILSEGYLSEQTKFGESRLKSHLVGGKLPSLGALTILLNEKMTFFTASSGFMQLLHSFLCSSII